MQVQGKGVPIAQNVGHCQKVFMSLCCDSVAMRLLEIEGLSHNRCYYIKANHKDVKARYHWHVFFPLLTFRYFERGCLSICILLML